MSMTNHSESDSQVEIQRELICINSVVLRIKEEMLAINEIVKNDGCLDSALGRAIVSLTLKAEASGVKVPVDEAMDRDEAVSNVLEKVTADFITEKLKMLS